MPACPLVFIATMIFQSQFRMMKMNTKWKQITEETNHMLCRFLNDHLLTNSKVSIHNGFVDDEVTLNDKTTFYINTNPGELNIRINKNENSEESCERVRQVCEELKQILADN